MKAFECITYKFARGIGSDETSWAVDVSLSRFLHNGEATPLERLGDLKIGDVISIGIDLDTFTICVQVSRRQPNDSV